MNKEFSETTSEITFSNIDSYSTLSIESITNSGYTGSIIIYGDNVSIYNGYRGTNILLDISNYSTILFNHHKVLYTGEYSGTIQVNNINIY